MNVKELKEYLEGLSPDALVIMSVDSEGNEFKEVDSAEIGAYCKKTREFGLGELDEEDREQGFTEEDVIVGGVPCVTLWPV